MQKEGNVGDYLFELPDAFARIANVVNRLDNNNNYEGQRWDKILNRAADFLEVYADETNR